MSAPLRMALVRRDESWIVRLHQPFTAMEANSEEQYQVIGCCIHLSRGAPGLNDPPYLTKLEGRLQYATVPPTHLFVMLLRQLPAYPA